MASTNRTKEKHPVVFIDCPRCAGKGHGTWEPDAGICYLCAGKAELSVDLGRSKGHLLFLRAKFKETRALLKNKGLSEEDANNIRWSLGDLTSRGLARKYIHQAALDRLREIGKASLVPRYAV